MTDGQRPRRGVAAETRDRLLDAAAQVFNSHGYDGTDSNRLARAAGYSPGTFYKHFPNKRACFLAVYEAWVTAHWARLTAILDEGGPNRLLARKLVESVVAQHRQWRGLRAGLRALVASDEIARQAQTAQRKRQLALIAALRRKRKRMGARSPADDALLLYAMERAADAVSDGEALELGLSTRAVIDALERLVAQHLAGHTVVRAAPSLG